MMRGEGRRGVARLTALSAVALAVLGYHPYAEDGGLYVAGIKKTLDPGLYAARPEFVLAHLRFSPFADVVAQVVRTTHVPLEWVLLALYCGSVGATLLAGWMIAARATESLPGRYGAVALLACWMSLPIAGTSLMLMDPYVTARSVSTPLALAAVAWAMDAARGSRPGGIFCGLALVAAMVHPLMAGYGAAAVALLLVAASKRESVRLWGPAALGAAALGLSGMVQALAPAESAEYVQAAITRYYWFPLRWEWYEQIGVVAPLGILVWVARSSGKMPMRDNETVEAGTQTVGWKALARMGVALGVISLAVALVFAHGGTATHLVARMQPLRCFQIVYEIMILLLGAWLGERWLGRRAWRWAALLMVAGGVMLFAQVGTYPASRHFEWPGQASSNGWVRAFVWARTNTPREALFALDAHYITREGEDAQGFRAIAERSALPDYSKDGGEASITPGLAEGWAAGVRAQLGMEQEDDRTREVRLRPFGVEWVVLERASATGWECPYQNELVKVCLMRQRGAGSQEHGQTHSSQRTR